MCCVARVTWLLLDDVLGISLFGVDVNGHVVLGMFSADYWVVKFWGSWLWLWIRCHATQRKPGFLFWQCVFLQRQNLLLENCDRPWSATAIWCGRLRIMASDNTPWSKRIYRLSFRLSEYPFTVIYVPASFNRFSDFWSRNPDYMS